MKKSNNPFVVSIVVTYYGMFWVEKCLGSLLNSNLTNHTILVIDNGSKDKTIEIIQKKFPNVILIETGKNLGFGKANNIGLKWAHKNNAEYIFLLNQDAWIFEDTIGKLITISKEYPEYGIISPVQFNANKTLDSEFVK